MTPAAYAVVDHSALRHNLGIVRQYAPGAKVMAVIKANGYGHGLIRVAKALTESEAFAVARVDEGILLREAGIKQPIAVLEGFVCRDELDLLHRFDLQPVIHCEDELDLLESISVADYVSGWLKLDTGMHRLGFDPTDIERTIVRINQCKSISKPISLLTHLANADNKNDAMTADQIALFNQSTLGFHGMRSIANSAGVLGWDIALSDWVRPGVMLFGVSPFRDKTGSDHGLKPVMSLNSRLLSVKSLSPGDAVGYGGDWICRRPMKLGVIGIGYGDGYPYQAGEGTPVLVNGSRVSLVGRVSMDMLTVDLSDCPNPNIGDPVILWGPKLPVEIIAQHASTIPYTLLCGITQRVMILEE